MALKPADMEDCSPKKKCLGGPNNGVAYTPGDECADGYVFNIATCDCDLDGCPQCVNRGNTSYSVTFDYQKHDTAPCAGYTLDPCDSGGACPTTLELNATRNISIGGPAFSITSFVEKQRYGASNPFCPANVEPLNVTWNEGYGFGVNKIFSDGEVYDGNSTDGFIGGVSNSLWALATDENGLTWAISVHAVWVGSITSTYRAGGYFNISVTPTGTAGPLPTCPSGQIWDCETCGCIQLLGGWRWIGTITRFCGTSCLSTQPNGTTVLDDAWWNANYPNGVKIDDINERPTIFGSDLVCTYDLDVTTRCRDVVGFESSFYMEKVGPCGPGADGIGNDIFRSPFITIGRVIPGPDPNACYATGFAASGSTLRMTVDIGSYVEATGSWYLHTPA